MAKSKNNSGLDGRHRMYAMMHLGDLCREFAQLQEELLELSQFPERNEKPIERIAFLRGLAERELVYIERVIRDTKQKSEKERVKR